MISVSRDNTDESSIPNYFENKEPPIICYTYNKPIRNTIFDFNKLVADFDIDTKTPVHETANTLNCYQPAGQFKKLIHIQESVLLFQKVLSHINFNKCRAGELQRLKMSFANDSADEKMSSPMH